MFKELLINEQINVNEVRVISQEGQQLGIMKISEAHELADKANLDLVCMNGGANPPVCKIMDYGKYKFDAIKKEKEAKKNQKVTELKEIQLSMTIDTHDLEVKAKHGKRFLEDGNKVKVVLRMRGRQQAYAQNAITVVKNFYGMLQELGTVDKEPEIVGRNIILIISPKTK
ncbi:MAG: translation initiation factor IF-3 [Eubacteriales bacterium]|nr:translation initiation factor IF-3 [Eubacteriales bacterium]